MSTLAIGHICGFIGLNKAKNYSTAANSDRNFRRYSIAGISLLPYQENISPSTRRTLHCGSTKLISLMCFSLKGYGSEDRRIAPGFHTGNSSNSITGYLSAEITFSRLQSFNIESMK